jgi:NadR type nicotinamide-nucleotide adenylyltransferase
MIKIAVIGPESTGKTTIAKELASHFNTVWVPEYAREFLNTLGRPYVQSDLIEIAKGQLKAEHDMAKKANNFLFCDTDLQVIKVWSEHKYGDCDPWILNQIETHYYDFYFLTFFDIPYEQDELRENPEERPYFFDIYYQLLMKKGQQFAVVQGNAEERIEYAKRMVSALL